MTIEYLEEQYRAWMRDLTSFCWIDEAVRELGDVGGPGMGGMGPGGVSGSPVHGGQGIGHQHQGVGTGVGGGVGGGRVGHGGGLEGKGSRGEL